MTATLLVAPKIDAGDAQSSELAQKKILYYSAFTEDLFYWDNDLNGDAEPKLKIQPNAFTKWVLDEQGQDQSITSTFQHYTNEKLTPHFSPDFSEVSFSFERGNNEHEPNIKISKGEESSFIWSVFYSLIEQMISELNIPEVPDRSTNVFNNLEYVFVDDPVSSLDENHLIELAVSLARLPYLISALEPHPDVSIVLSTSWARMRGFSRARDALPHPLRGKVIGSTWHSKMGRSEIGGFRLVNNWWDAATRHQQIAAYIARAKSEMNWLALDDNDTGWSEEHRDRLVLTDSERGLSDPYVQAQLRTKLASL